MPDFNDLISQTKKMQEKMKETQEALKKIEVEGISGGGTIKVTLNGDGEMVKLSISPNAIKENKEIVEDLILAAHGDAKKNCKQKLLKKFLKLQVVLVYPPDLNFLIEEKNG